jgi:hypothetical protein
MGDPADDVVHLGSTITAERARNHQYEVNQSRNNFQTLLRRYCPSYFDAVFDRPGITSAQIVVNVRRRYS